MIHISPGQNRPWFRRKTRLGLLGTSDQIQQWTELLSPGNWFSLTPLKIDPLSGRVAFGLDERQLESLDGLVVSGHSGEGDFPLVVVDRLRQKRQDLGLPGTWPVFQSESATASQAHDRWPVSGFGGIQTINGPLNLETIYLAGFDYSRSRGSSFSQAFRTVLLMSFTLAALLWWGIGLLLFGLDPLLEKVNQIRAMDHPKLEMRLNQTQSRLARFADLCREAKGTKGFESLEGDTRSWLDQRLTETENYLSWVVPLKGVGEPKDAFSIKDSEQFLTRGSELKRTAFSEWRTLDSYKLLEKLYQENEQMVQSARSRLQTLDQLRREAIDLGSFVLGPNEEISSWQKKSDAFLEKQANDSSGQEDRLLELVEAQEALKRAVAIVRTERKWITLLGLASPGKGDSTGPFTSWRANWFDQQKSPPGPSPFGSKDSPTDVPVKSLPTEFREKVASAAKAEETAWLALGARELEKIWPGRDLSMGIPQTVNQTVKESSLWDDYRKWVILLQQLQTSWERPIPTSEEVDPWLDVERLANSYPPTGSFRRVVVEGPLSQKSMVEGKIRLEWRNGDQLVPFTTSMTDELRGLGVIRVTFEAPMAIQWVGNRAMSAVFDGENGKITWESVKGPSWASWAPLLEDGKPQPTASSEGNASWRIRTIPGLPILPGLLRK